MVEGVSAQDAHGDVVSDGRSYSELVLRCLGEQLVTPASYDTDGIERMWVQLDSLDTHDERCTPDCLTRTAHAQQLLVARLARPRLTPAQLDQMSVQAWNGLPQSRRQSLDYGDWADGFVECARLMCDVVDDRTDLQ